MSTTPTVRLGNVTLGTGRPKVLVPLMPATSADVPAAVAALEGSPVDIVEWRLDHAADRYAVHGIGAALRMSTGLPVLATYRTDREGGLGELPDADYAELVSAVITGGFADAIDVEYSRDPAAVSALLAAAHGVNAPVVASFHDFHGTPSRERMVEHLRAQAELGADILKIAVTPQSPADVAELLAATAQAAELHRPLISISMGSLGLVSRVAAETFGSCATFATVGAASAPGQIPAAELAPLLSLFARD